MAAESLEEKMQRLEKMAQRSQDIQEIQNVASLHEYYHSALMHAEEIDAIWAQKTPGVSWTNNTERYEGMASLRRFYVERLAAEKGKWLEALHKIYPEIEVKPENYSAGILWVHTLTTPVIQVAGDGQTAKGVWMSWGHVSGPMGGQMAATWAYEKYGMDFVKEDGEWKLWHLHTYVDFYSPVDGSWVNAPANETGNEEKPPAEGEDLFKPDKRDVFYVGYAPGTVPKLEPRPPVPYYTFSETFSY